MADIKTKNYNIVDTNTNPKYIGKNLSLQEIKEYNKGRKVKKPANDHSNKPKKPSLRDLVMQLIANDKIIFERLDRNDIRLEKIEERLKRLDKLEDKLNNVIALNNLKN